MRKELEGFLEVSMTQGRGIDVRATVVMQLLGKLCSDWGSDLRELADSSN